MKNIKGFYQFVNEETDGSTTGTVGSGMAVGGGAQGSFTSSAGVSISGGDSGTAFSTNSNSSGMGNIWSAQPSNIPGDVRGGTKGSGDVAKGYIGPFSKLSATRKNKKSKKSYAEKGAQIDKFYVTNYREKPNKGGRMVSSWKVFNEK